MLSPASAMTWDAAAAAPEQVVPNMATVAGSEVNLRAAFAPPSGLQPVSSTWVETGCPRRLLSRRAMASSRPRTCSLPSTATSPDMAWMTPNFSGAWGGMVTHPIVSEQTKGWGEEEHAARKRPTAKTQADRIRGNFSSGMCISLYAGRWPKYNGVLSIMGRSPF